VHALGQDVVVYRGETGRRARSTRTARTSARHLGHGGEVVGNAVRCPFHAWCWSGDDGRCVEIPYAKKIPPKAAMRAWPCSSKNDLLYVWHHVDGVAPSWEPDRIPEVGARDYHRYDQREWIIKSQPAGGHGEWRRLRALHDLAPVGDRQHALEARRVRYCLEIDVDTQAENQAATAAKRDDGELLQLRSGLPLHARDRADGRIAMNMLTPLDPSGCACSTRTTRTGASIRRS